LRKTFSKTGRIKNGIIKISKKAIFWMA